MRVNVYLYIHRDSKIEVSDREEGRICISLTIELRFRNVSRVSRISTVLNELLGEGRETTRENYPREIERKRERALRRRMYENRTCNFTSRQFTDSYGNASVRVSVSKMQIFCWRIVELKERAWNFCESTLTMPYIHIYIYMQYNIIPSLIVFQNAL